MLIKRVRGMLKQAGGDVNHSVRGTAGKTRMIECMQCNVSGMPWMTELKIVAPQTTFMSVVSVV